jgi:hypothetical protein
MIDDRTFSGWTAVNGMSDGRGVLLTAGSPVSKIDEWKV